VYCLLIAVIKLATVRLELILYNFYYIILTIVKKNENDVHLNNLLEANHELIDTAKELTWR
jgi:hypothetical protein